MIAEISYTNEAGFRCQAVLLDPNRVHHYWWSSRRNAFGRYEKHEVTYFSFFLSKVKKCKEVSIKVYDNR